MRDYGTALRTLDAAARRGDPQSQYLLGCLNLAGLGTAVDRGQALRLFEQAADQGHARAAYALAA